jgi:hypothetical protein
MAKRISVRNDALQKVVQNILEQQTSDSIVQDELSLSFPLLKKAANDFLKELENLSNLSSHQSLLQQMQNTSDKTNLLYGNMRSDSLYTRQVLKAQHEFEKKVNEFLNRKIYLTYVDEQGSVIAYDDIAVEQIYQQATGNVGRGNINPGAIRKATNIDKEVLDINKKIQKSVAKRKEVYLTAIQRWESNSSEGNKNYNPSYHTFYWRLNNSHNITGWTNKIDSRGVIAEGYAEAVINNKMDVLNNQKEVSLFNLWHNYIKKDSVPAAVKGDVVLADDGSIQFAIKQGQFSTAKIGQYINLAYNITRLSDNITKKNFYLALPKLLSLNKTTEKVVSILNNKVEDTMLQLVKMNLQGKKVGSEQWNITVDILKN